MYGITLLFYFSDADLLELRQSKGKHAQFICDSCKFYRDWHVKSDGVYGNLLLCNSCLQCPTSYNSSSYLHLSFVVWYIST